MGTAINSQGQSNATNQLNQFLGNLNAQLYTGKDGTANAAADVYGAGTSVLYGSLALAAKETSVLPGPIGWTGNAVSAVVSVVSAPM